MSGDDMDPVHRAVMARRLPEVARAIERGGDVNALDREGRTPLFYAAMDGDAAIVTELLRHGADVNAKDKGEETPLHFAARGYQPAILALLLKGGAGVDTADSNGNTPLWRAVFDSQGRGEAIQLLLNAGARPDLKNKHGVSPQELARSIGNHDVARFFA